MAWAGIELQFGEGLQGGLVAAPSLADLHVLNRVEDVK